MSGIYGLGDIQAGATQQGANTVIDFGSGNKITLANITVGSLVATDFVFAANSAPTDILLSNSSVAENSAAGTVVGALSDVDPDAGDTATFTLIDDAGGRFAINAGNIVVAGALDFETATSHSVTVLVTNTTTTRSRSRSPSTSPMWPAGVTLNGDANNNVLTGHGGSRHLER